MTKVLVDRQTLELALNALMYSRAMRGRAEFRKDAIKELRAALAAPQAPAPLTDEQIDTITEKQWGKNRYIPKSADRAFARAIEKAHGITGEQR